MFLAIDIGGTKTLLAVFSDAGEVVFQYKLATKPKYEDFLADIKQTIGDQFKGYDILYCCCAVPGYLDKEQGIAIAFGNLDWRNVPIKNDIAVLLNGPPVVIENDAKLAALSEALLVQEKYKEVLYLTISTGIGDGVIINSKMDPALDDSEAGQMVLQHNGQLKKWEDIASGKAIVKRFGKKAAEIDDPAVWATYAADLAIGLRVLISVVQPEVVIIGGGVGAHFDKFGKLLIEELNKTESDMVKIPPIIGAQRAEEAVIYGCYEFIKQQA